MFGDVFHGGLLTVFAMYLCLATPTKGSLVEAAAPIRYFALLMGIFSVFCGFCYNDFASVPIYTFGDSCYTYTEGKSQPDLKPDCVYPVGVDPSWYLSTETELSFMNSLKMKLAVIFGVAQMCLGIFLKGSNALHARSPIDFLFEFVPQIITMLALFGFMDYLIMLKWMNNYEGEEFTAPGIITSMIDMFLRGGVPSNETDRPLIGTVAEQTELMQLLVLIVLICVPLMLLVKPIWFLLAGCCSRKKKVDVSEAVSPATDIDAGDNFISAEM